MGVADLSDNSLMGCPLVPQEGAGMAEVIRVDLGDLTEHDFQRYTEDLRKVRRGTGRNPYLKKALMDRLRYVIVLEARKACG